MTDLVGRTARGIFRDLMTDSTVGAINTAFQDEGFAPNPDCRYEDSSVRRQTTQSAELVEHLLARFPDLSESSIRAYLSTLAYINEAGVVRRRTDKDPLPPVPPLT